MKKRLVIIGAGGHARSVADSIDYGEFELYGFIDKEKTGERIGRPIFGRMLEDVPMYKECSYIIGIGNVYYRRNWFEFLKAKKLDIVNVIDKTAIISQDVRLGIGNFIGKGVVINSGVTIGDNNLINSMALIEHESVVKNHTNISTRSTMNGDVTVEDMVFLGSGAICNGQLTLRKGCVVGSGSVVTSDIDPYITAVGVPARMIRRGGNKDEDFGDCTSS